MGLRMTEEEYREYISRNQRFPQNAEKRSEKDEKRSKYGNTRTEFDGKEFDSRHEAKVYAELRARGLAGEIKGLARQVTFFLPGGVKYIADFVTLNADGSYTIIDAKSEATRKNAVYRLKKKQMKNCLGLDIVEIE